MNLTDREQDSAPSAPRALKSALKPRNATIFRRRSFRNPAQKSLRAQCNGLLLVQLLKTPYGRGPPAAIRENLVPQRSFYYRNLLIASASVDAALHVVDVAQRIADAARRSLIYLSRSPIASAERRCRSASVRCAAAESQWGPAGVRKRDHRVDAVSVPDRSSGIRDAALEC